MLSSMKRKAVIALIAFFASLLVLEGAVSWRLSRDPASGFRDPKAHYSRLVALSPWQGGNWLRDLSPHPYFGFVLRPENGAANNFGFREPESFPYRKSRPDELVIGVLGGSVAMMWAGWAQTDPAFLDLLREKIPKLRSRPIKLLNLALAGHHQPQQFFVSSYFTEMVDLFLNIEGHNELEAYTNQPLYPVDYPAAAYLTFSQSKAALERSKEIQFYSGLSSWFQKAGAESLFLQRSALFFLLADGIYRWTGHRSALAAEEAKKEEARRMTDPRRSFPKLGSTEKEAIDAAILSWEKFVYRQHSLLGSLGKKHIFFLQPNQYMPDSKDLSEWEREFAINKNYLAKAHGYSGLAEAVKRLETKKVNIHDLTMVFKGESRTVYTDNCCHLNDLGNRILAEGIVRKLAAHIRF